MTEEFNKKFVTNRDETGRFIVKSIRTERTYYVEAIGSTRPADWGSYNPSTGKIENKKGFDKFSGAISEGESLITAENGFDKISYTKIGESPFSKIEELDAQYKSTK